MRRLLAVIAVMAFPVISGPQRVEHAPTKEACSADYNLWASQSNDAGMLPYAELQDRIVYLRRCATAHQELNIGADAIAGLYQAEISFRLQRFITKHGLLQKFLEEDAAQRGVEKL